METESSDGDGGTFSVSDVLVDVVSNPVNLVLLTLVAYFLYKLLYTKKEPFEPAPPSPSLPPMKKRDMTPQELKKYDGKNEEGRVCVAVNGKIFDVTKGRRFYGPGGPYEAFAGRDATRGLATFSVEVTKGDYDDLSDLNTMQMESVKEWEMQFKEKYQYVGRLLRPGEEPTDYSDEEESSMEQASHEQEGESKKEN